MTAARREAAVEPSLAAPSAADTVRARGGHASAPVAVLVGLPESQTTLGDLSREPLRRFLERRDFLPDAPHFTENSTSTASSASVFLRSASRVVDGSCLEAVLLLCVRAASALSFPDRSFLCSFGSPPSLRGFCLWRFSSGRDLLSAGGSGMPFPAVASAGPRRSGAPP